MEEHESSKLTMQVRALLGAPRIFMFNKKQMKEYNKLYFQKNKNIFKKRGEITRARSRKIVEDYKKNKKCVICGDSRFYVLDFHHRDPDEKEFGIASGIQGRYGKDKLIKEMEKCNILCSNCHREFHFFEKAECQNNDLV